MGDYVTEVWGWDEQFQRDFHSRSFNPRRWQIITMDVATVGMIDVGHRAEEIYLARIEILPTYQGRGIGGYLISALICEAAQTGKDLVLDVLTVNRRAQALYLRLGFIETGRQGDGDIKTTMRAARRDPRDL